MASEGPVTVAVEGFEVTSNNASAEEMVQSLKPVDPEDKKQPRVIRPIPDKPKAEAKPETKEAKDEKKPDLSKAAAELGRQGGKAAAEARARSREAEDGDAAQVQIKEPSGDAEPGGEAVPTEGVDEKPLGKPRDDPRARMLEATRREAELKRIVREQEARLADLERSLRPAEAQRPQREPLPFKPEDFETYEEYLDARDEFRLGQLQQIQARQAEIGEIGARIQSHIDSNAERMAQRWPSPADYERDVAQEIRELLPSYHPEVSTPGPENVIADEIMSSPLGPDLQVYLSEHPDEFQRLLTLPHWSMIQREISRIEGLIGAATTAPSAPRGSSKALPPVRTVTGTPTAADPFEVSDDMDDTEWLKRRNAQLKASSARR